VSMNIKEYRRSSNFLFIIVLIVIFSAVMTQFVVTKEECLNFNLRRIRSNNVSFSNQELRSERFAYYNSQMDSDTIWDQAERSGELEELSEGEKAMLAERLNRVAAAARSLGGDFSLKVSPGRGWAYNFETNTVTVPYHELLSEREEVVLASSIHEAAHREISRVIDISVFERESKRALWNAIEDPRVNNWMIDRYAGVEESFMVPLYERIFPTDPSDPRLEGFKHQLPHLQFLAGIIHYWAHGEVHPLIGNPEVLDALERTREDVQGIYSILPQGLNPNEREIRDIARQVHELIEEKIYPIYQELVQDSIDKIEDMLKSGAGVGGESGQTQASSSGLSPEELSEKARDMVEQASKEIADALGDKVERPDLNQAVKHARDARRAREEEKSSSSNSEGDESGSGAEQQGPTTGLEGLLGRIRDQVERQREFESARDRYATPYSRYLREVVPQTEELVGYLEHILEPDLRSKREGFFWSGSQISIPRILQSKGSGTMLAPFTRRTRPVHRSYNFSLLLDESGSMAGEDKAFNLKCAAVLFMEVLERLKIDYEVAGFHSTHIVHKEFGEELDFNTKDERMIEVEGAIGAGMTHDVEAINMALDRISQQSGAERIIIVITDGEGNGSGSMPDAIERARREGIYLIGVGIGDGMAVVAEQYDTYVQVENVNNLPSAIARIIEQIILGY
jgi:hypothetical protein